MSRPASARSTRPGYSLSEDLAEQRRQDARRRRGSGRRRERAQMPLWQELPLLLVVAFCLAVLIRSFLLQAFYIPSGSMEQTLLVGDRVLVNKIVYDVRAAGARRGRRVPGHRPVGAGELRRRAGRHARSDRRHPGRPGRREPAGREGLHQAGHRPARRPGGVLRRPGPGHGQRRRHRRAVHRRELALWTFRRRRNVCGSRRFAEVAGAARVSCSSWATTGRCRRTPDARARCRSRT